jgi:hypothetical protein
LWPVSIGVLSRRDGSEVGQALGHCQGRTGGWRIWRLAGSRLPPHNVNMGQDHPFTVEIREHLNEERRFGWNIFENGKARDESPMHFATKREAVTDAQKVMQRLVTRWQTDK